MRFLYFACFFNVAVIVGLYFYYAHITNKIIKAQAREITELKRELSRCKKAKPSSEITGAKIEVIYTQAGKPKPITNNPDISADNTPNFKEW